MPEWMGDENGLFNNGVWTYDLNTIPDILSRVLGSWMQDRIPETLCENMDNVDNLYTFEGYQNNVNEIINGYINDRINELKEIKTVINNKNS